MLADKHITYINSLYGYQTNTLHSETPLCYQTNTLHT